MKRKKKLSKAASQALADGLKSAKTHPLVDCGTFEIYYRVVEPNPPRKDGRRVLERKPGRSRKQQ
jgi:hypothetical protein